MKKDDLLTRLVAHYWDKYDFRKFQKRMGWEKFDDNDWRLSAALRFVTENEKECERIFNHRHIFKAKGK